MTLSSQLLWNFWSDFHETWYVDRTSYGVMHIGGKFWSPHFCGSYAPWNLENIYIYVCVCVFGVWGVCLRGFIPLIMFYSCGDVSDVTITGKGLQILTYARLSWTLNSRLLIMVTCEDPWHPIFRKQVNTLNNCTTTTATYWSQAVQFF